MKKQQFKCTLLSDVIINTKSASEGPNETLDFIPGNCFLGIVASSYDSFDSQTALDLFHNGKVRFGDAHLAVDGARTIHVPASLFCPKLDDSSFFQFHLLDEGMTQPMKQRRNGFFDFRTLPPKKAASSISFSIKSGYDRDLRRSQDEKMFGYEALSKGLVFYFDVESDKEELLDTVTEALIGKKRVGRSRSAQYGLVSIEKAQFTEVESTPKSFKAGTYTVYADSRLIFIDKYGLPTAQPSAQDLGFPEDASIVWELSQIRTFQYAPYNWKRKCFDTDRFGIEKGSVFVVRASCTPQTSTYVGHNNNEGFGKVIYNPEFLAVPFFSVKLNPDNPSVVKPLSYQPVTETDSLFIKHLKQKNNAVYAESLIFHKVNAWVSSHSQAFNGERMASQWGAIRAIAMERPTKDADQLKKAVEDYTSHGVTKPIWDKRKRRDALSGFINDCKKDETIKAYTWLAVINLASTMAKVCNNKHE